MRLRVRDMPCLVLEIACWAWLALCAMGLTATIVVAVIRHTRGLAAESGSPVIGIMLAAVPALLCLWPINRYFGQRRREERELPGFDVLPPR